MCNVGFYLDIRSHFPALITLLMLFSPSGNHQQFLFFIELQRGGWRERLFPIIKVWMWWHGRHIKAQVFFFLIFFGAFRGHWRDDRIWREWCGVTCNKCLHRRCSYMACVLTSRLPGAPLRLRVGGTPSGDHTGLFCAYNVDWLSFQLTDCHGAYFSISFM